ncbi:hypothetical protein [Sporichthya polymorpha]|uniref:hypothetical protein n=1 Tax=Sporichthya polymorpha TaxID=35751 RepID=UPI0012EC3638|nr:hypothetical protein [Sporichthya polymorpha]
MAISRADRRALRSERARAEFGRDADVALDVLELTEFAWHDCYNEITPPDEVVDDIFVVAQGNLATFVRMARLAVEDFRDLRLAADAVRGR